MNLREDALIETAEERTGLGIELGRAEFATRLLVPDRAAASPLHGIYLLRRTANRKPRVRIERLAAPAPAVLLAAGYGMAVRTPARLIRRLDICAHLARRIPVFTLEASCQAAPDAVVEAVLQHAGRSMK
jgi:hypothetical protein